MLEENKSPRNLECFLGSLAKTVSFGPSLEQHQQQESPSTDQQLQAQAFLVPLDLD